MTVKLGLLHCGCNGVTTQRVNATKLYESEECHDGHH